MIVLAKNG